MGQMDRLLHLADYLKILVPLLHHFDGLKYGVQIAINNHEWRDLNFLWDWPEEELKNSVVAWLKRASESFCRRARLS
jgi:hypothetical protein